MRIQTTDLAGARLVIAKAKLFGVHTPMYEIRHLTQFDGQQLHFLWERDDHSAGPVAGFFRDLGGGINAATDAVAGAVETVVNTIGQFVSGAIEAIGVALATGIDAIGGLLGLIPFIGPFLQTAVHWVSTIVSAAVILVASVVKAVVEIIGGVVAALVRIVGGFFGAFFALDARILVKGLYDLVVTIVGPLIAVLGKTVALLQAIIFMQLGERGLTAEEASMLYNVYRNSVFLFNVRVVDGFAGLFSTNDRPFTLGNTIYMKETEPARYNSVLVHECAHVWQNQHHGQRYVGDALFAQAAPGDEYEWRNELDEGRIDWRDFNAEAQAEFVQAVFDVGVRLPPAGGPGQFFNDDPIGTNVQFIDTALTSLARETITFIRSLLFGVSVR
jgi:hypothetical protein